MRIEVFDARIKDKVIHIYGESIRDQRQARDDRARMDRLPMIEFRINTLCRSGKEYAIKFLHDQAATKGSKTYGEAVQALIGTRVDIQKCYRVYDS